MPIVSTLAGVDGDAQLGADAVGGGHQDRVGVARRLEVERARQSRQAPHHVPGRLVRLAAGLIRSTSALPGVDVHARIGHCA
jgi:hypothetical protein